MPKRDAEKLSSLWKMQRDAVDNNFSEFELGKKLPPEYREMRNRLRSMFDDTLEAHQGKTGYSFDIDFGMKIYLYYTTELRMTPAEAAQDPYWIFIQMSVVPDIIYRRWPPNPGEPLIKDKRFWKSSWRLYLKVLWWYIYLSWSESEENTLRILSHNEDSSQLTDRPGDGFRVDVTREIMSALSRVEGGYHDSKLLSRVLMLHGSYCATMEPELMDCSLREYAEKLFEDLGVPLNERL